MHVYACDSRTRDRIEAFDVMPDSDTEQVCSEISGAIQNNSQTLILTDIVGATPSNIATKLADKPGIKVLSGVNLPVVLTALCHRDEDVGTLCELAKQAGAGSIEEVNN